MLSEALGIVCALCTASYELSCCLTISALEVPVEGHSLELDFAGASAIDFETLCLSRIFC